LGGAKAGHHGELKCAEFSGTMNHRCPPAKCFGEGWRPGPVSGLRKAEPPVYFTPCSPDQWELKRSQTFSRFAILYTEARSSRTEPAWRPSDASSIKSARRLTCWLHVRAVRPGTVVSQQSSPNRRATMR
jgi:hypothetical protein